MQEHHMMYRELGRNWSWSQRRIAIERNEPWMDGGRNGQMKEKNKED